MTDARLPSGKAEPLRRTPLYSVHLAQFAHMGGFAGYEMPLRYAAGTIKEHIHTRTSAGLFDISHMGQVEIRPKSGDLRVASFGLEGLMPVDVVGLKPGRQRYAVFTNNVGGIIDDLMIANRGDCFFLVVNASRQIEDIAHLRARLPDNCEVVPLVDRALLALQGPKAEAVLSELTNDLAGMSFMDVRTAKISVGGLYCLPLRIYRGGRFRNIGAWCSGGIALECISYQRLGPTDRACRTRLAASRSGPLSLWK